MIFSFTITMMIALKCYSENFILIGDSQSCGAFGKHFQKMLTKDGHNVTLYCAVSSTPQNWLKGIKPRGQVCKTNSSTNPVLKLCNGTGDVPLIKDILERDPDAHIIVQLGANSLYSPITDINYQKMAKTIQATSRKCHWIGPAHRQPERSKGFPEGSLEKAEKNLNPFYDSLANSIQGPCLLIDSRDATAPGTSGHETVDGVHHTDAAGKYWAEQVMRSFRAGTAQKTLVAPIAK